MEAEEPKAKDAWIRDARIRNWFEVVIDAASVPQENRAYICKCCWQTFVAEDELSALEFHIEDHERSGGAPYESRRQRILTGEQLIELHRLLLERFEVVIPEAGTWKFQCKTCRKRFPHRSDHRELLGHSCSGEGLEAHGSIQ